MGVLVIQVLGQTLPRRQIQTVNNTATSQAYYGTFRESV